MRGEGGGGGEKKKKKKKRGGGGGLDIYQAFSEDRINVLTKINQSVFP